MSIPELLVATAIAGIVLGAAIPLLAKIQFASLKGMPEARRVLTRNDVRAEFLRASDTAAKVAYFDLQATVAPVRAQLGGGRTGGGGGGGTSGAPEGYCLLDLDDESTWPPGFDPRDQSTWYSVPWWEGVVRSDSSTWYWDCRDGGVKKTGSPSTEGAGAGTGAGLPTVSLDVPLEQKVRFGSGVRVGERLAVIGPVAVSPEGSPVVADQVGDAVTFLRTDPQFVSFSLGGTFQANSGVVRLVARDEIDVEQIMALMGGDMLIVTGRTSAGEYATALASLTAGFHQVALPSVANDRGEVLLKYYEAPIRRADERFGFGLRNSEMAEGGVDIQDDAAVALLDRAAPVVTYYTVRVEGAGYTLRRAVGDPVAPNELEEVAGAVAAPLTAGVEYAAVSSGTPGPEQARAVTLRVPISAPEETRAEAEPIEAYLNLTAAGVRPSVLLRYRYLGETSAGGGGGK